MSLVGACAEGLADIGIEESLHEAEGALERLLKDVVVVLNGTMVTKSFTT
jgi:hypothetical protein